MPRKPRRFEQPDDSAADGAQAAADFAAAPREIHGVYQSIARGGGFVVPDTAGIDDIRIPAAAEGEALHGDRVIARVTRMRGDGRLRGSIEKIVEHANKRIVGRILHGNKSSSVIPRNRKLRRDVLILQKLDRAKVPDNAWVEVEVTRWSPNPETALVAQLIDVIGEDGTPRLPITLLVRTGGVAIDFPPEVEAEAHALQRDAARDYEQALAGRADFRQALVCTIDPATAKDFDDAVSLVEITPKGRRIAVHIADVAHYVTPGTQLDADAYGRATSVYPVDRVIPMLPEALSNDLCSLKPNVDRLTMTAIFTVDDKGQVSDVELANSVIHSVRRFAYEEVQAIFEDADRAAGIEVAQPEVPRTAPEIDPALYRELFEVRAAARALNRQRMGRGALDLDLPEMEIVFDDEGRVIDLRRKERFEAHRMIEELMIAANEAVARELERRGFPALYRVHAPPDELRLAAIAPVLARLGIALPGRGGMTRAELQAALEKARRHPAGLVVQRWVLRAMMRAKYQPENEGHFGLASESYLHFTSPIRRYPDLIVHRSVKLLLAGYAADSEPVAALRAGLTQDGKHTSAREERAQKIEWDAEAILALQFMRRFLGDVFDGHIAGVSPMGFYVELVDYPVEGLVRVAQLDDDYYELDEEMALWRGRRNGRVFGVGDPVKVLIERIDTMEGQMDLLLVRKDREPGMPKGRAKSGKQIGLAHAARSRARKQAGGAPIPPRSKRGTQKKGRRK